MKDFANVKALQLRLAAKFTYMYLSLSNLDGQKIHLSKNVYNIIMLCHLEAILMEWICWKICLAFATFVWLTIIHDVKILNFIYGRCFYMCLSNIVKYRHFNGKENCKNGFSTNPRSFAHKYSPSPWTHIQKCHVCSIKWSSQGTKHLAEL